MRHNGPETDSTMAVSRRIETGRPEPLRQRETFR
jgi:hypothetical protein